MSHCQPCPLSTQSKSDIGLFLQLDLGCKLNDLNNSYVSQSVSVVSLYRMSLLTLLYPHCCNAGTKYTAFISVRLLSVLCGHSVFSSPPQRPMTSDFEGFLYQILSITIFSYLNSWERASISLFNVECYFYNVFGMTRSLTGDWTQDLPHSMPALYH